MLAGSAAVHIRWVPHLCGHPVVQQPPCFPASTGPLSRRRRGRGGRGGGRLLHTGLHWLTMISHVELHTHANTQTPTHNEHKYVTGVLAKQHAIHVCSTSPPLWRDKEEVRERKSQGPWQIGCVVAHGDNIWERSVCCWDGGMFQSLFYGERCFHSFWGSLIVLNIQWETEK